jgi:hypothetical protein
VVVKIVFMESSPPKGGLLNDEDVTIILEFALIVNCNFHFSSWVYQALPLAVVPVLAVAME